MKLLSKSDFNALIEGAELLKSDRHGPKVYRRSDATYVKLFRQKRLISLSTIFPYVKHFKRNSIHLTKRGIDTVKVNALYHCPEIKRTIITYDELEGELFRTVLTNNPSSERIQQLARFLAELHKKGIYFRSIHLENIVLQPNGKLGLIDIADMRIRWYSLGALRRVRNFCHLFKYQEDVSLLSVNGKLHSFLNSYLQYANLNFIRKSLFVWFVHRYIDSEFEPAT